MVNTEKTKSFSPLTIGLAFFSMFFGSGNLVFPLFLGQYAGDNWAYVAIGFLLTGVIAPLLGVIAMVAYQGDNKLFFSTLGKKKALIFVTILMLVWIPFGAAPRCIRVGYESFAAAFGDIPLWLFGIFYSLIVYFSIIRKSRMIEVLGHFLTPTLLVSLGILCFLGLMGTEAPIATGNSVGNIFYQGVIHGYETMDLIASFFFSLSIITVIQAGQKDVGQAMKKALFSGLIGMGILALVYLVIIYLAARNSSELSHLAKDQLLPFISKQFLGVRFSIIPVVAIILACLTTSVAMLSVFSDFVKENYLSSDKTGTLSVLLGVLLTYILSLFTFDGLMVVTTPILEVSCPLLVLLTLYNLIKKFIAKRKEAL